LFVRHSGFAEIELAVFNSARLLAEKLSPVPLRVYVYVFCGLFCEIYFKLLNDSLNESSSLK